MTAIAADYTDFTPRPSIRALGTIQRWNAEPVAYYSRTSARCVCDATISRRSDGQWWHGAGGGMYCRPRDYSA